MINTVQIWFNGAFQQQVVPEDHLEWYVLNLTSLLKRGTIHGFRITRGETRNEYSHRMICGETRTETYATLEPK